MTGEQVVRVCRAVAKHLAAFADDFEQITTETSSEATTDAQTAELKRNERRAATRKGTAP